MSSGVEDDLTPGTWNFTRTRGDVMAPTSFDVVVDGSPSTADPVAQVRVSRSHTSELVLDLDATVDGSSIVVGEGVVLDVDAGVFWWDLQVDGLTVVGGVFRVLSDVSEA